MTLLASIAILTNLAYVAAFDTVTRCPAWVAYDLEPGEIVVTNRASIGFSADPRIAESDNAEDYAGSGYDRGHMAPAADFNFDRKALAETYYYSNVCPQLPAYNRGQWADIEREVRDLARSGTVHVLTFPVYVESVTNKIGRVRVPQGFRKVAWGSFGVREWIVFNFDLARAKNKNEKQKEGKK